MKKLAFIGALITVPSGAFWTYYTYNHPTAVQPDDSTRSLKRGNDLLNIGRYPEAKQAFEDALKSNPQNSRAAWGLQKANAWDASKPSNVFEQTVKSLYHENPKDEHVNLFMGKLYASGHTSDGNAKAIGYYQTATQINPAVAEAYFDLGVLYDQTGQPALAEDAYQQAVNKSGTTAKYRNNLAYWYFKQHQYPEALQEYGKTSQFPLSALESAKIDWRLGKLDEAQANQSLALQWLDDAELMKKPEQQDPWYFEIGNQGVELIAVPEKKSYAWLCLSVSQFLLGHSKQAEASIASVRKLKLPRQSVIDGIVRVDLDQLAQSNKALAKSIDDLIARPLLPFHSNNR